jgi:hypothetical protein
MVMDQDEQARGRQALRGVGVSTPMVGMDARAESSRTGRVQGAISAAAPDTVQEVVDTLLVAEQLMMTFYYTALTSPTVMHDHQLGGPSADPNNPGLPPGGMPRNVRFLQAALDAEVKHAAAARSAAATGGRPGFYFPATAFARLGSPVEAGSFLSMLDTLETMCVGVYIAAARQFLRVGRPDLARVATQIMGVEAEHRMLGRVIGAALPANNLTLERAPYASVGGAGEVLRPFVTGRGVAAGKTLAVAVPTAAQANRVIGRNQTHFVAHFRVGL